MWQRAAITSDEYMEKLERLYQKHAPDGVLGLNNQYAAAEDCLTKRQFTIRKERGRSTI